MDADNVKNGEWVSVLYDGEEYVGKVIAVVEGQVQVRCLSETVNSKKSCLFEKENHAVFYKEIYSPRKIPTSVYINRKYLYKFE